MHEQGLQVRVVVAEGDGHAAVALEGAHRADVVDADVGEQHAALGVRAVLSVPAAHLARNVLAGVRPALAFHGGEDVVYAPFLVCPESRHAVSHRVADALREVGVRVALWARSAAPEPVHADHARIAAVAAGIERARQGRRVRVQAHRGRAQQREPQQQRRVHLGLCVWRCGIVVLYFLHLRVWRDLHSCEKLKQRRPPGVSAAGYRHLRPQRHPRLRFVFCTRGCATISTRARN